MYKFSPTTGAFYREDIHPVIPEDAIQVSDEDYKRLMLDAPGGRTILVDADGKLRLSEEEAVGTPIPITSVTSAQARVALIKSGDFATVDNAIMSMEGVEGEIARARWEYAGTIDRDSDLVKQMAVVLGWDDAKLDELFQQASKL